MIWPLVVSLIAKVALAGFKFRYGRKLKSDSLMADAWNDAMDTHLRHRGACAPSG